MASALMSLALFPGAGAPAQAQPTPSAVVLPAAATVTTRSLAISPVANTASGSITANFLKSDYVKGRKVLLYKLSGTKWVKATSTKVKMTSAGVAVFKVAPAAKTTYKAVAPAFTYKVKKKKVTAPSVETTQATTRTPDLYDEFTTPSKDLNSTFWSRTRNGDYTVAKRWCSAPKDANATISKGVAKITMSKPKLDATTTATIVANAKTAQQAAKDAALAAANALPAGKAKDAALKAAKAMTVDGCPTGIYDNARVSTEGKFVMTSGILAAKVKFPKAQGLHGGIWVRTVPEGGSELDMVEAFGLGKGIQNVVHIGVRDSGVGYETPEAEKWVAKSAVKKSSWWSKYHVFSMEWDATSVTYRLDGVVTKTKKTAIPIQDYYIVMSMLSSDWETGRLTKPTKGGVKAKLPESMQVEWVKAWKPVA
ncbi:family 16 glycosylhydrolase [Propionicimonas sp.]|uniref:glycoside hydrolase family 16 protein n=1 Tax=Propionicimonas sp. TaxID=1955623 RepID=UPI0039E6FF7D